MKAAKTRASRAPRVNVIKRARLLREGTVWFAYDAATGMRVTAADSMEECERRAIHHGYEVE